MFTGRAYSHINTCLLTCPHPHTVEIDEGVLSSLITAKYSICSLEFLLLTGKITNITVLLRVIYLPFHFQIIWKSHLCRELINCCFPTESGTYMVLERKSKGKLFN